MEANENIINDINKQEIVQWRELPRRDVRIAGGYHHDDTRRRLGRVRAQAGRLGSAPSCFRQSRRRLKRKVTATMDMDYLQQKVTINWPIYQMVHSLLHSNTPND